MRIKSKIIQVKDTESRKAQNPRFGKKRRDLLTISCRNHFLRYFQQWYRKNISRFSLPLFVVGRGDHWMEMGVGDMAGENIRFYITTVHRNFQDGSLNFFWEGEHLDHLLWMETSTTYSSKGFYCKDCHDWGEDMRFFETREALWEDHIFEPILNEINTKIAICERIEYRKSGGSAWVVFVKQGEDPPPLGKKEIVLGCVYPKVGSTMKRLEKYDFGDAQELEAITLAANAGSADAQYRLGKTYELGFYNVEKNEKLAFTWFLKAAEQGHVLAQGAVAWSYFLGAGVAPSSQKAEEWMLLAIENAGTENAKSYFEGRLNRIRKGDRPRRDDFKRILFRKGLQKRRK